LTDGDLEHEVVAEPVADTPEPSSTEEVNPVSRETEPEQTKPDKPSKPESVRESIARSVKEVREKVKPPAAKPGAASPGQKAGETAPSSLTGVAVAQNAIAPPPSLTKAEQTTLWPTLSPEAQKAFARIEEGARKGVEQLRTRYQELDNAVAPYRDTIKRLGFQEAQAVDQLFKWQMALAGPDKIRAFVHLMQSHGVDPATFANALQSTQGAAQPNAIPPEFLNELNGLKQKIGQFDQHFATQTRSQAEQTVMTWAKDKPHYQKVRGLMGQFIQSGAVPLKDGNVDLDAAYDMAIHAHPEVRGLVFQEQQQAAAAERKAAAEKARKAGSSMRTGTPAPIAPANGLDKQYRNESARDSIKRAFEEYRAQKQA